MILKDKNIENGSYKSENLRILYKNLFLLFETDIKKLNEFIKEIIEEIQEKNIKKKEIIDKAENSLQEYDLLFFDINSLKQALIPQCEKISQKVLNNILKISNPNDSIFFLMKTFYWIIKGFDKDKNQKKNEIQWNYLQNNLNYKSVLLYLSFISNSTMSYLTNEDLDESMPFLVNYDRLKNIFNDISKDLVIVLDFVKSSLELNVKLNIMNSLYENNCNKNAKIENIDISINNLNNLLQKGNIILSQINLDFNNYKEFNYNEEEKIKNGYLMLEKYSIFERYSVERERRNSVTKVSTIKFIVKLNKKFRDKEKFVNHLFISLNNFNKGKRKLDENKFISDIIKFNNKTMNKGRNYDNKYDLNSIKEENYSTSLNTQHNLYDSPNKYSNNILDVENNTGRYSYSYNYDWFNNISNNNENRNENNDNFNENNNLKDIDNIIPIQNKIYNSLVIKGNIEKNKNNLNNIKNIKTFPTSSLNALLKKGAECTIDYETKTKSSYSSEKTNKIKNLKKPILVPKSSGNLSLEKEENSNYCSYLCFKNYK